MCTSKCLCKQNNRQMNMWSITPHLHVDIMHDLLLCSCLDTFEVKQEFRDFLEENKISFVQRDVGFNQEPFVVMSEQRVAEVLRLVMDPANQPVLLLCKDGKVRSVGSVLHTVLCLCCAVLCCVVSSHLDCSPLSSYCYVA